ncbi:hypothetical protein MBLNU13_g00277t2 [Cladosporium sp. NU13]
MSKTHDAVEMRAADSDGSLDEYSGTSQDAKDITSTFSLINGGRAGTVWSFLATWILTIPVVASMAEMASMSPSAGGQYQWVSEWGPPSMQKILSYISGWLAALGWQAFIASSAYQTGNVILILASMNNPSYVPTVWQGTLMTMAVGAFAISFNAFAAKHLPLFEGVILVMFLIGFFVIIIPLWVLAPRASVGDVFGKFENWGGWSSMGGACIVGQMAASAAFIGVDSAVHMAEEVKNASRTVPRMVCYSPYSLVQYQPPNASCDRLMIAPQDHISQSYEIQDLSLTPSQMMATVFLNGALGFIMIVTFCFAIQSVEEQIIMSSAPYPFVEVFATATGSTAAAIGMTVPMVLMTLSMCINSTAAASRQAWSFARDDGLPFPRWFTRLVPINSTPLPINAMITSLVILVVVALLNFGGSEVFNSIIGLMTGAVGLTYALSIGCVLWRRLYGEPLPPARWSLGRWAVPINIIAVLYELFSTVISFFPLFAKVDAKGMNWGIAMFGGVAIICLVNYFVHARKIYQGPVVHVVSN